MFKNLKNNPEAKELRVNVKKRQEPVTKKEGNSHTRQINALKELHEASQEPMASCTTCMFYLDGHGRCNVHHIPVDENSKICDRHWVNYQHLVL